MIARGFKPVAWVAAVGAAALGCYMLSHRVAAERAELTGLERKIVATEKQIRSLETELGTRGRVQQLQQWNEEILALAPPAAGQYLDSQVTLARFDTRQPVLGDQPEVRMASAEVPAAPAPAAPAAAPQPQRAVAGARPATPTAGNQPRVQRASLTVAPGPARARETRETRAPAGATTGPAAQPARTRTASTEAPPRTRAASAPARGSAAPARRPRTAPAEPQRRSAQASPAPRPLLDPRTVRDLRSTSRAERGGGTRD